MHCSKRVGGEPRRNQPTALFGNAERLPEQRLRRRGAKGDDHPRLDRGDLGFEPRKTRGDLHRARLAVNAPRAARHPFEMLDRVGDVGPGAVDPGLFHAAVEQFAGRTDERMPGQILGIARLLADKHDAGVFRPLAEDGLRRVAVQRAGGAFSRRLAQLLDAGLVRDQPSGARLHGIVGIGHDLRLSIG